MSRPRFFNAPRKGENFELRADLNSEYRDRRSDAIKRVIANMTVGKDVSGLFPDVLKNMQTEDLEQKKLVYLYLINYAKTQPELVILAVNTFVKVSHAQRITSFNPLIPTTLASAGHRRPESTRPRTRHPNHVHAQGREDHRLPF